MDQKILLLGVSLIVALAMLILLNINKLLKYIWLQLGPRHRWVNWYLIVTSFIIAMIAFCMIYKIDVTSALVKTMFAVSTLVLTIIGLIGGLRQRKFDKCYCELRDRTDVFSEQMKATHYELRGQVEVLEQLKQHLIIEKDPEKPLVIAVDGMWGDGKTYIVERALSDLPAKENNYIVVRFSPWRYPSEEAIITGFYNTLSERIGVLPGAKKAQIDLAALSRSIVSKLDKTGTLESYFSYFPKKAALDANFEATNQLLIDSGKRLLVIIDDIERCLDKFRILRALQLGIHVRSDLPNSTTILIADVSQIIKVAQLDQSYAQKIFDESFYILPPTKEEIFMIINRLMENMKLDIKIEKDQRLSRLIRNIRGVKRVLIGIRQDYKNIGDNIHPQDIFAMNVLKHAYPTIYTNIAQNPALYVPYEYGSYDDEEFLINGFSGDEDDSAFAKSQVENFERIFNVLALPVADKSRLTSILEGLFPSVKERLAGSTKKANDPYSKQHRRERRMGTSRIYLERYFRLNNDPDKRHKIENAQAGIKATYFAEADEQKRLTMLHDIMLSSQNEDEDLFYGGLSDILSELDHSDENRKVIARDMLRLYFRETNYLVRDEKRSLLIIADAINNCVNNSDYDYIFDHIENYMTHPSTGLRLLLYMNPMRQNSFYDLKSYAGYDDLRERLLMKVDIYYVREGKDIMDEDHSDAQEWRFTIAQWSTSVCYDTPEKFVSRRFEEVNKYLMDITKNSPEKFHRLLMGAFWHGDFDKNYKFVFNSTPQPYKISRFITRSRELLKNNKLSKTVQDDLISFIQAYSDFIKTQVLSDTDDEVQTD